MALEIGFYPAEFHNTDSTSGAVGGAINSSAVLSATLNSFLPQGVSDYIGQSDRLRFQKLFVKNTGTTTINNPKIFLNNVKHVGQIKIATGALTDSGTNATGYPAGYSAGSFSEPIGIINATSIGTGAITGSESIAIWIKQTIGDILPTETGASTTIGIIGEV